VSSEAAAVTLPPHPVPTPEGCYSKFVQQPFAGDRKVDIVFVTDTSGSLDNEENAVADALDLLVSRIDPLGDYHIGVLPAHGSLGPSTGLLWKGMIELCPTCTLHDPGAAGDELKEKFRDLRSDPDGSDPASDGGEMGMYSLHRMVTDRAGAGENTGLRPDAALAVIFLSDENDICGYPPITSRVQTASPEYHKYDPEQREPDEYTRTCDQIDANGANVLAELHVYRSAQPVFVGGILYDNFGDDSVPRYAALKDPNLEDEIGYGYRDMIGLAAGISADLALTTIDVAGFNQKIVEIGDAVAGQLITEVVLDHVPVVPQTIHQYNLPEHAPVAPDPSDYDPQTNSVTLHSPGAAGDWIQINYCPPVPPCDETHDFCLEDDGPSPCPAPGQYRKALVTGGTPFSWGGDTSCTRCELDVNRFDVPNNTWVPTVTAQVKRNMTFTFKFGVAGARFDETRYRFTYRRFFSGDDGPPPVKVCYFDVYRP
jgi:hypothetical protein